MHAVQERRRAVISDYLASDTSASRDAIKPGDKEIGVLNSGIQARIHFDLNPHTGHVYPFNAKDSRKREARDTFESVTEGGESFRVKGSGWRERPETTYSLLGRSTVVHDARRQADCAKCVPLVPISVESRIGWRIDPDRVVRLVGWKKVPSICQIKQLIEKCTGRPRDSEAYEEEELRILLERKYRHISEITDPRTFWLTFLRSANCAYRFYSKGRILHSINTLGYSKYGYWKEVGVLMDFDLASLGISEEHKLRSRSGTAPFMAREVLDCEKDYTPKFHHELESLLYVLIWHTLGYDQARYPADDILRGWRKSPWHVVFAEKNNFLHWKWKEIFPHGNPNEGFLHNRCRWLCAEYFDVTIKLGTVTLSEMTADRPVGGKPVPAPISDKDSVVTYPRWVWSVGINADACNGDCCV